ncbi:hypothetical protein RF007C_15650 [Ruminococcus flavefaciens 007c]|uniref:Uncharacterized protein n=1 Tax=Ruminococcus flavefaciens 007c TaxID=1341157 RepID=W7UW00_RUMFL|nr:hypothetical protein RF007C_15650 [Ruminococcus flavefaciens 007c]
MRNVPGNILICQHRHSKEQHNSIIYRKQDNKKGLSEQGKSLLFYVIVP